MPARAGPAPILLLLVMLLALERQLKAAYLYEFAGFVEWPHGCFARPDSALERAALQETLAARHHQPVLTVSDSARAHALGSMINFIVAGAKLRCQVALKPVAAARMTISARMLAAAFKVQPGSA